MENNSLKNFLLGTIAHLSITRSDKSEQVISKLNMQMENRRAPPPAMSIRIENGDREPKVGPCVVFPLEDQRILFLLM